VIQSGFQGLTEGKQAGYRGKREAERDGEERATDLFDGKLQRCLEERRRLTALELNTTWSLYLLRAFPPASWLGHTDTQQIFIYFAKNPIPLFPCSHPPTSPLLCTETVSRSERIFSRLIASPDAVHTHEDR
jgi:hypothetical protein